MEAASGIGNYAGDGNLRLDLICGHDFYLRLSLVKLGCADNADDFPLERAICGSVAIFDPAVMNPANV